MRCNDTPTAADLATLSPPEFEDLTCISERALLWIGDLEARAGLRHVGRFFRFVLAEHGGALRDPSLPGSFLLREAHAGMVDLRELSAWAASKALQGADESGDPQEHAVVAALAQLAVDLAAAADRMEAALPFLPSPEPAAGQQGTA